MSEPIKLPPMPMEEALKRAYYYTEAGEWRYPETCNEWDRWHSVAKVVALAVQQATAELRAENEALRAEVEAERMRVVTCGVVAVSDTPDSAAKARDMHPDYRSPSCDDVARRVDECISLRAEREALRGALHQISLCSQNSMSTIRECGRIARAALKEAK